MTNYVTGLNIKTKSGMDCEESEICEGCMKGKSSVQPFGSSAYGKVKSKALLEVVHSDLIGPMRVRSQGGSKYMVTFIDDFSRFIRAHFIQTKGKVFSNFIEFKALVENQFGKRIKCLRSDNGGEYINEQFANLCRNSVPYSPQQNGLPERMNPTLTERAIYMLSHMQVEEQWWAEAMNTAVYVTNRKPSIAHFKVFEAQGYAHIDKSEVQIRQKNLQMYASGLFRTSKGIVYAIWKPSVGNDSFS
uniref:Putative polyprotein n=1 Tax=Albugo laibachii Nc14 TaxID=890382 RepID=F0WCF2_9STRA|nr:putative polyprotein [Albugo laibachii Nc14]|eukprot:CCA18867.1 putative polyprotein [Albugo laibachii Nc14]